MLTPEYLAGCADRMTEIASGLESYIVAEITKRLAARLSRGEDFMFTPYDKWQMQVLEEAGVMHRDILRLISKYTGYGYNEIKRAMEEAAIEAIHWDNSVYYANGMGLDILFPGLAVNQLTKEATQQLFRMSPYYVRAMERAYNATNGTWENLTRTQAYSAQTRFVTAMDKAYNLAVSGATSYTKAIQDEIDELADNGLSVVVGQSGRAEHIDVAAARCVRTGISQMSGDVQTARMDELGIDLVLVSAHLGARPSHEVWQGKVYSRSGKSDKYPDFVSSTGYGTGEGLCGWNCRHSFGPYMEGMHNPFEGINTEESNKRYQIEQGQRAGERRIRAQKRKVQALDAELKELPQGSEEYNTVYDRLRAEKTKLSEANKAYSAYCEENELRPLTERLRITDYNAITVGRAKNQSTNDSYYDIITREKPVAKRYPVSQKMIDSITNEELGGINFSAKITYNGRIGSEGKTSISFNPLGRNPVINSIEIGKQYRDTKECLIDTILHEELEARIAKRHTMQEIIELGDDGIHPYIDKVIKTAFRLNGWKYENR